MSRVTNCQVLQVQTKAEMLYLGGSGTRMLTVDNDGNINAQAIPSGGGGGSLGDPGSNGFVVRTALDTTLARTIAGTANLIVVTNGDGVAGNPIINVGANVCTTTNTITLTNKTLGTGTKINLGTVALGDMYYGDASGNLVRVGPGTDTYVWTRIGATPGWAAPTGGGGGGAISYFSATDFAGSNTLADPIRLANGNGLSDPGSNGIMVRTASGTLLPRSILGTASQIVVSNGDGVNGAPTLSLGTLAVRTDNTQTISGIKTFSQSITVTGSANGIILQSPNGNFWRIQVTDSGTLTVTNTGA